jgi:cation diffusion facilitator CzcD-associated flavoprotein CzcO
MPAAMTAQPTEHFDVLIVGAGISGVGGAYHLTHQCHATSFVMLEEQESFGHLAHASLPRHPLR